MSTWLGVPPVPVRDGLLRPVTDALDRLATVAPAEAARARSRLDRVLGPVAATAWPEVATRFSTLTGTGFPVELAWTSRDAAVRWTSEVAPPEVPYADRLGLAAREAGVAVDRVWRRAQDAGPLAYGAWLGMRHRPDGDAGKVYLELPGPLPAELVARHRVLAHPAICWRMAGLNDDGSCELYGRGTRIDAEVLDALEATNLGSRGRLSGLVRRLVRSEEVLGRMGVSVLLDAEHRLLALTWFTVALAVWRSDAVARAEVAALGAELDPAPGSLELWRALTDQPGDGRWQHTVVGVGLAADGGRWVQAGVRPT